MTFVRYVGVQAVAYAIDMGVFLALHHVGMLNPATSNLAAKVCAGCFAFLVHRGFTFGIRSPRGRGRQALRYFIVLAINAPVSSAILVVVLHVIPHAAAAKVIADVLTVALTYLVTARLVFRRPPATAPVDRANQRIVSE